MLNKVLVNKKAGILIKRLATNSEEVKKLVDKKLVYILKKEIPN